MEKTGYKIKYKAVENICYLILKHLLSLVFGFIISKAGIKTDISPFSLSLFSISPFIGIKTLAYYIGSFLGFITKDFSISNFKYICANTVMLVIILIFSHGKYYKRVYSPVLPGVICFATGFIFLFADSISMYSVILLFCESILTACTTYFMKFIFDAIARKSKLSSKDFVSLNITLIILICALDNYYFYGISLSFVFCTIIIYLCCYYFDRKTALLFTATISAIPAVLHPTMSHYFILLYLPSVVAILISKFEKKHIVTSYYITYITVLTLNLTSVTFGTALAPLISAILYVFIPKNKLSYYIGNYIDIYTPHSENEKQGFSDACQKFNDASQVLIKTIENTSIKPILDVKTENKIKRYLHSNRCRDVNITNYYNESGKQIITLFCKNQGMFSVKNLKNKVSEICKNEFVVSEERIRENEIYCRLEQSDRFKVECFALYKAKNGETVCGDNICAFKSSDGKYNLMLADGMGSGKEAYTKSSDTVILLKKLLKSGVETEEAIKAINSTMQIFKEEVGFSTIDLCSISLFDGVGEIFKCGAYTSLILRDKKISKINGGGFPAGLTEQMSYTKQTVDFKNGDIIIMMSDGLSSAIDEIQASLLLNEYKTIESLTREIIDCAYRETPKELDDDMTVLTARITERAVE